MKRNGGSGCILYPFAGFLLVIHVCRFTLIDKIVFYLDRSIMKVKLLGEECNYFSAYGLRFVE